MTRHDRIRSIPARPPPTPTATVAAARAASAAHLHADAGRPRQERRRLPLDARRPPALRLHLRRAGRQPRPQPDAGGCSGSPTTWAGRPPGATPERRPDGYFPAAADDRLQRRHRRRDRGEPAAGRRSAGAARRRAAASRCMWAASGSEAIQKALWAALARDRTAADDPRHALRLPRQEGPGRRRHRLRDRPRARPARPLHLASRWRECRDVADARRGRSTRRRTGRSWTPCSHQFGRQDRRAHHRAVPRRRRLVPSAEGVPAAAPAVLPRARHRLHPRRGAGELRPHRRPVRVRDLRRRAGHRRARQGAGQRRAGRGGGRPGATCSRRSTTAKAPTPGAPTRSAAPPCWRRSTSSRPATCSAMPASRRR